MWNNVQHSRSRSPRKASAAPLRVPQVFGSIRSTMLTMLTTGARECCQSSPLKHSNSVRTVSSGCMISYSFIIWYEFMYFAWINRPLMLLRMFWGKWFATLIEDKLWIWVPHSCDLQDASEWKCKGHPAPGFGGPLLPCCLLSHPEHLGHRSIKWLYHILSLFGRSSSPARAYSRPRCITEGECSIANTF